MAATQARDPSHIDTAQPLLALSGELRNLIWRLCLRDATAVVIASNGRTQPLMPLASVCVQVREEVLSLWPDERDNTGVHERVRIDILDLHFSPLFGVLQKAQTAHNTSLYPNIIEIRLVFSPTTCDALDASILGHCKMDIHSYLEKKLRLSLGGADFEVIQSTVGVGKMSEPMLLRLRRVGMVYGLSANEKDLGGRYDQAGPIRLATG